MTDTTSPPTLQPNTPAKVQPTTPTFDIKTIRRKYAQGRKTVYNWISKESPQSLLLHPSSTTSTTTEGSTTHVHDSDRMMPTSTYINPRVYGVDGPSSSSSAVEGATGSGTSPTLVGMWIALNIGVQTGTTDFSMVKIAAEAITQQRFSQAVPSGGVDSSSCVGAKRCRGEDHDDDGGTSSSPSPTHIVGRVHYSSRAPFTAVPVLLCPSTVSVGSVIDNITCAISPSIPAPGSSPFAPLPSSTTPTANTDNNKAVEPPGWFLGSGTVQCVSVRTTDQQQSPANIIMGWVSIDDPHLHIPSFLHSLDETPLRVALPPTTTTGVKAPCMICPVAIKHIPGLYIVPNFVTPEEEQAMLAETNALSTPGGGGSTDVAGNGNSSSAPKWSTMHRRDVMHFMRRYEYATNSVISAADASDDLPGFYNWVADRLEMGIMPSAASSNGEGGIRGTNPHWPIPKAMRCDQVTINRYTYDQQQGNSEGEKKRAVSGISHHVDSHRSFGPVIFSLSLASTTVMEFQRPSVLEATYNTTPNDEVATSAETSSTTSNNNVISIPQRRSQALQTLVSASGSSATAASSGAEEEERLKQLLRDGGAQKENILLEPRSLLILTGEARYLWTHCIAERQCDIIHDGSSVNYNNNNMENDSSTSSSSVPHCMPRGTRVSFTFRKGRDEGDASAPSGPDGWGDHSRASCPNPCMCDATY